MRLKKANLLFNQNIYAEKWVKFTKTAFQNLHLLNKKDIDAAI